MLLKTFYGDRSHLMRDDDMMRRRRPEAVDKSVFLLLKCMSATVCQCHLILLIRSEMCDRSHETRAGSMTRILTARHMGNHYADAHDATKNNIK